METDGGIKQIQSLEEASQLHTLNPQLWVVFVIDDQLLLSKYPGCLKCGPISNVISYPYTFASYNNVSRTVVQFMHTYNTLLNTTNGRILA